MDGLDVIGGPLDGRSSVAGGGRPWAWLDGGDLRAYGAPAAGRALYVEQSGEWRFCGAAAYVCGGCGALIGRPGRPVEGVDRRRCPLCGAARQQGERGEAA